MSKVINRGTAGVETHIFLVHRHEGSLGPGQRVVERKLRLCRGHREVLWAIRYCSGGRASIRFQTIRMKKTAPPTLGLAGNNAAGNGARGVHGAEIGRDAAINQAQIKMGRSEDRPIALEAIDQIERSGLFGPELLMALSAGSHEGLKRCRIAIGIAGLSGSKGVSRGGFAGIGYGDKALPVLPDGGKRFGVAN